MTKQHFIALADLIRNNATVFSDEAIDRPAGFCAMQNPRFKRGVFMGYLAGTNGPNGGKVKRARLA